ncbi:MAG TPA: hypothetical protein VGN17_26755 [Bryobacteraceae bacterium]|jgi:hypothetical protein
MPGKYFRGAFIEFTSAFLIPIPNIILFQYNPESLVHTWTPAAAAAPSGGAAGPGAGNPLAVTGNPGEEFSFSLALDSSDTIADGSAPASALASISGIYPTLAALEMLLFPSTSGGGSALASAASIGGGALGGASSGVDRSVPVSVVPTVLFVWGPGRILPVRVSTLKVTEKLYDPTLLVPTHADVEIGLKVLTQNEIDALDDGLVKDIVQTAYDAMGVLRQGLARANIVNSADALAGMLPF